MKNRDCRFLFWLLAGALALRLLLIQHQSLWVDELLTLKVSVPKPGLNIWDYLQYNIHGPLHAFIIYVFHFVNTSDAWLRLPSALAGTATVFFFYRWVSVWLGKPLARLAAAFLAIHPLHIYYSQEVRNYSLLFLCAMWASDSLHRLLVRENRGNYLRYIIGIVAAALSNFTAAFVYVTHTVLFLWRRGGFREHLLRWLVVSLCVLVLISPWVYRIYKVIDVPSLVSPVMPGEIAASARLRGETTADPASIPHALFAFSVGFSMGPSIRELHDAVSLRSVLARHGAAILWVALLFGGLGIAGALALLRGGYPWRQVALYLGLPFAFTLLLSWQNAKAFNVRYVMLALPPYLCVLAAGPLAMRGRLRVAAIAAIAATMLFSLGNYYLNGRYAREDVRAAVRYIAEHAGEDDCVLVPTVTEVFAHYDPARQITFVYAPPGTPAAAVDDQVERRLANCHTVWYVRARPWVDDSEGYLSAALDRRFERAQVAEFNGVTIFLCRREFSHP